MRRFREGILVRLCNYRAQVSTGGTRVWRGAPRDWATAQAIDGNNFRGGAADAVQRGAVVTNSGAAILMHDPRLNKLADILLDHSCRLEAGEKVLIEAFDLPEPQLVCALVEGAAKRGAVPLVTLKNNAVLRSMYRTATEGSM